MTFAGDGAGSGGRMIYTVTLNPTLDITYVLDKIVFGEPLKALEVIKSPGGKGINVSRALRAMGTDSVTMGLVGGHVGEEVLDLLQDEGLILQIVRIKRDTRTNVIILGARDHCELVIKASGPPVDRAEADRITNLIFQIAQAPEILVLSGSLPPGVSEDIYHEITMEGKSRGSKVVLDSQGAALAAGLEAGPYLVKPNLAELQGLAGRELVEEPEIIEFCRGLSKKGVEIVVVSLGGSGALMVTRDRVLRGVVPVVSGDTVGAGDSMVAGLVMGIIQSLALERVFQIGLACSVAAVMNQGPGLAEPETFAKASALVRVENLTV